MSDKPIPAHDHELAGVDMHRPQPTDYLPRGFGDTTIRITKLETCIPHEFFPGVMFLRIHTDAGIIGHGETYYAPHAVAALIHDFMSHRLLGSDALAVESHWRFLYERCANFGVRGAELRAISAIDLALWDILGQVAKQPIYRLLGGPVRPRVPVYNTCGGPTYGAGSATRGPRGWPGYGSMGKQGKPGQYEDLWAAFNRPAELAQELLEEGHTAMKFWSFDPPAHRSGGMRISFADLEEGMKPLREIRKAVGNKMELAVEGHGFFQLPAALRIAHACKEIDPLWLEDVLKMDNIATLADFRDKAGVPISASEMLLSRSDYNELLAKKAADFVMIDPTWNGGISETMRVAAMAGGFNLPVTMHDCTGPLTAMAGIHINAAAPNANFQETVRAHIKLVYPKLIDKFVAIEDGHAALPEGTGLCTKLDPALFVESNSVRSTSL